MKDNQQGVTFERRKMILTAKMTNWSFTMIRMDTKYVKCYWTTFTYSFMPKLMPKDELWSQLCVKLYNKAQKIIYLQHKHAVSVHQDTANEV